MGKPLSEFTLDDFKELYYPKTLLVILFALDRIDENDVTIVEPYLREKIQARFHERVQVTYNRNPSLDKIKQADEFRVGIVPSFRSRDPLNISVDVECHAGSYVGNTGSETIVFSRDTREIAKNASHTKKAVQDLIQKIDEKLIPSPQVKERFLTTLQKKLSQQDTSAAVILELFHQIKNPEGLYAFIHIQRNPRWDSFRLFFKRDSNPAEKYFWHTSTYQKAVKMLQESYQSKSQGCVLDSNELMNYVIGNAPPGISTITKAFGS